MARQNVQTIERIRRESAEREAFDAYQEELIEFQHRGQPLRISSHEAADNHTQSMAQDRQDAETNPSSTLEARGHSHSASD